MNRRGPIVFGIATALHVAVLVFLPRARVVSGPVLEPSITIDVEVPIEGAGAAVSTEGNTGGVTGRIRVLVTGVSTAGHTVVAPGVEAVGEDALSTTISPSTPLPSLFTAPASIGLDGHGFSVDVARHAPPAPEASAVIADNIRHAIMDPIHEHENENGTLADGPVVVELEKSTRQDPAAPHEGRAVFAVRIDEVGLVVSAQVVESSGDRRAWEEIAKRALNALAQKQVRIPPGAKGVDMHVEITARVVLPGGGTHAMTAQLGGPSDPTSSTLPVVSGQFDLSNVGARPVRVVGAHVLSERAF